MDELKTVICILYDLNLLNRIIDIITDSSCKIPPVMRHNAAKLNENFDEKLESYLHAPYVFHIVNRAVKDCKAIVKPIIATIWFFISTI